MKICLVHEEYPEETNFGGIATYQKVVAEEFVKQGNKVYVICRGLEKDKRYVENGVNVIRLFVKKSENVVNDYIQYRKRVAQTLLELQNEKEIDIVEVPDWGAETIFFEKDRSIPLVVRLHTPLKIWLKYNKNDFGKVKKLMLKWESQMLHSANIITCCSNALKNIVVKDFKIEESRIIVTPNPANITNFFRDKTIDKKDVLIFVGSLEERKGVLVLASALNIVLKKYPNLRVQFIGKDTNRNRQNISTKQLICNIVDDKYKSNIDFLGQIPNSSLNYYLNSAKVGVFPSLFDNFPYVVLEAMATGLQIVGSRNSGMVEMLNDDSSIYDTGDYNDLANKIIEKYELAQTQEINELNITRVKILYDPTVVCRDIIDMYKQTIKDFYINNVTKNDLENVLGVVTSDNRIISLKREKGGVSNFVFRVYTKDKIYIIKKYFYDYNFNLSNELYSLYQDKKINIIRPINREIINYNSFNYNIFEYKKIDSLNKKIDFNYIQSLLNCDRKTNSEPTILEKCMKYYLFLKNSESFDDLPNEDVNYVINMFELFKNEDILKEKYLNHGDISRSNMITSKKIKYIIDLDEVTVTTALYDFAVVVIKLLVKNNKIDMNKYNELKDSMKTNYVHYEDKDFIKIVRFYLCKILIEKFYLHKIGKIDLYSKRQLKDPYFKYLTILKNIEKMDS